MNIYLLLTLVSGFCWSAVYVLIIIRGFRDKACGMPLFALGLNIAWEMIFGVGMGGGMNVQRVINIVWSVLDLAILAQAFMYGRKEFPARYRTYFPAWAALILVVSFGVIYAFSLEFPSVESQRQYLGAQYAAFLQNLVMSVLFISMLVRRQSTLGQSVGIAWFKLLGTLAPTLMVLLAGTSTLIVALGAAVLLFDGLYIWMLSRVPSHAIAENN